MLKDRGRLDQAIVCFEKAIRLNPALASYRMVLGHALRERGDIDSAIACFRESVRLEPGNRWTQSGLIVTMLHKGNWEEAVAAVLRRSPTRTILPELG